MNPVIYDLSRHDHLSVTGEDRRSFVNGLCTSNIATLDNNNWLRTCFLNAKGRVLAVADVVARPESLWLVVEPGRGSELAAHLDDHAIMDDVEIGQVSETAHYCWRTPSDVWDTGPQLGAAPADPSGFDDVEAMRIEAGLPRDGVDVTDKNFPFESLLSRVIDYQKGCYLGQEPVARVHYKGRAQRTMCGLRLGRKALAGAVVVRDSREIATVTSTAISDRRGPIGLAYLRRDDASPGAQVEVDGVPAQVAELPFG